MRYGFPHLIIAISALAFYLGGVFVWSSLLIIFIIFPLIEYVTRDLVYRPPLLSQKISDAVFFLMPFSLSFILYVAVSVLAKQGTLLGQLGVTFSTGVLLGAFGITSAHELIHRNSKWQRALGVYNLMLVNFAHWGVEHVFGHHKNVGTPADPATARLNENIYFFWVREYFTSLKSAFRINFKKCSFYWFISIVLSLLIYFNFGGLYLAFWWGATFTAILLLQTVDYIEHYGLQRHLKPDGTWAPFSTKHAWDSSSYLTNIVLFNLGMHSHHHLKASLPYTSLQVQGSSPQMPLGYSFMVILALIPWVFIPIMNRRILQNNS